MENFYFFGHRKEIYQTHVIADFLYEISHKLRKRKLYCTDRRGTPAQRGGAQSIDSDETQLVCYPILVYAQYHERWRRRLTSGPEDCNEKSEGIKRNIANMILGVEMLGSFTGKFVLH